MSFRVSQAARSRLLNDNRFLVTEVTIEVIEQITSWMIESRPAQKKFTLVINSAGGDPTAVLSFASFAATLAKSVRIEGVAFGICGSAALALLQCCHTRTAVKHCGFFVHHLQHTMKVNCQKPDVEGYLSELVQSRAIEDELVSLQCARSGLTRERWMELADEGEEISGRGILPKEALGLGLIDHVRESYRLF